MAFLSALLPGLFAAGKKFLGGTLSDIRAGKPLLNSLGSNLAAAADEIIPGVPVGSIVKNLISNIRGGTTPAQAIMQTAQHPAVAPILAAATEKMQQFAPGLASLIAQRRQAIEASPTAETAPKKKKKTKEEKYIKYKQQRKKFKSLGKILKASGAKKGRSVSKLPPPPAEFA
jgi:hypothetical protein